MSKGIKKVLGIVAAIAIPFAAPMIAGALGASAALAGTGFGTFLGTAGGSALTGAALGGLSSAATGGDPLRGAIFGGIGGFAGGGGFNNMFGGAQTLPGQASTGSLATGQTTGAGLTVGQGGGASLLPGATTTAAQATGAAAGTAGAAGGVGGFLSKIGTGILNNPAGMAQLAMTVYGATPQELTPAELANLEELKGLAETNRELFDQKVMQANEMMQMARQQAPNPEQAFAQTKIATERQLAENTRGMGSDEAAYARRQAGIRSSQTGATAAAAEEARGTQAQTQTAQAAYGMLPSQAPQGAAGLSMPIWQSLEDRRYDYTRDLARASGDLLGGVPSNNDSNKSTNSSMYGNIA